MAKRKSAEKMAEIIEEIYEEKFGGKSRGRFQISRSAFRQLSERKKLHDSFIDEVAEEALELGYVLVSLGDTIAIIEEQVMLKESAAGFLAEKATVAHLRALRDSGDAQGFDSEVWREIVLGLRNPALAFASDDVEIEGGTLDAVRFLRLFR